MNLSGILFYVSRAAKFALVVCAVYAFVRAVYLKAKKSPVDWKDELERLLFVAYFAALAQIIALRGGTGNTRQLRLIPFHTTVQTMKSGLWPFVYNFVGNVVWFVPLGMFLHRKKPVRAMLIGAAVSLSLELMQWILMTGVTDVDDVIINALGALMGNYFRKMWNQMKKTCV